MHILAENYTHLLEGGTEFSVRYPYAQEEFVTNITGDRFQVHGRQRHDGNLLTKFNEHSSDVLRITRVLEETMYGYRGNLQPPPCILLVHSEGEPTRTFRDCLLTSVQYGSQPDIMEIEANWVFRECDFRGGIATEANLILRHAQLVDEHFAILGRQALERELEQPERVNWQIEGF